MDNSKKSDSPPAVQERRRFRALPWIFLVIGGLMLALSLPNYYRFSTPFEDDGFPIAMGILLIWMSVSDLRRAGSEVQSWLSYAFGAILFIHFSHPSTFTGTGRDLLDALTFAEPIASAFLYPALLAAVIVVMLLMRADRRKAREVKPEAAGVEVEGD